MWKNLHNSGEDLCATFMRMKNNSSVECVCSVALRARDGHISETKFGECALRQRDFPKVGNIFAAKSKFVLSRYGDAKN